MFKSNEQDIKFSVIIPLHNEENNITQLHSELINSLKGYEYEVIYVNDGSTDSTYKKLITVIASEGSPPCKIISMARRKGQSFAFKVGLDNAIHRNIVFMDGDMQNDPKDIPGLVKKFQEGYDLVQGIRGHRMDLLFFRVFPSKVANLVLKVLCKSKFRDLGCTLKIFSKKFSDGLSFYQGIHRVLPIYFALKGAKFTQLELNHRKRVSGKSKYGFSRIAEVLFEIIKINFFERGSNTFILLMILLGTLSLALIFTLSFFVDTLTQLSNLIFFILFLLGLLMYVMASMLHIVRSLYIFQKDSNELNVFPPEITSNRATLKANLE